MVSEFESFFFFASLNFQVSNSCVRRSGAICKLKVTELKYLRGVSNWKVLRPLFLKGGKVFQIYLKRILSICPKRPPVLGHWCGRWKTGTWCSPCMATRKMPANNSSHVGHFSSPSFPSRYPGFFVFNLKVLNRLSVATAENIRCNKCFKEFLLVR